MTNLDLIIIDYIRTTYHSIHSFLFMKTFGVYINMYFFGAMLIFFAIHQLEHNQKVQVFLQSIAEKGLLKYLSLMFIALVIFIVAI